MIIANFIHPTARVYIPLLNTIEIGSIAVLCQLWLWHDKSLPENYEKFCRDYPPFRYRLKVKAGLTGYAQLYGKYNTRPYDKLKMDLYYIESYSLWLDLKLIILTVKILFMSESTEGVTAETEQKQ